MKKFMTLLFLFVTSCVSKENCVRELSVQQEMPRCRSVSFYIENDCSCNHPNLNGEIQRKLAKELQRQGFSVSSLEEADFRLSYNLEVSQEWVNKIEPFYLPGGEVSTFGHVSSYGCSQGFSDWDFSQNSYPQGEVVFVPIEIVEYTTSLSLTLSEKYNFQKERDSSSNVTSIKSSKCNLREVLPCLIKKGVEELTLEIR